MRGHHHAAAHALRTHQDLWAAASAANHLGVLILLSSTGSYMDEHLCSCFFSCSRHTTSSEVAVKRETEHLPRRAATRGNPEVRWLENIPHGSPAVIWVSPKHSGTKLSKRMIHRASEYALQLNAVTPRRFNTPTRLRSGSRMPSILQCVRPQRRPFT